MIDILKTWTLLLTIGCLTVAIASARETNAIVAELSHEDFKVRNAALKELEAKKLSNKALRQLIDATNDPETKDRLEFLWRKQNHFIPFKVGSPFPPSTKSHGRETDGTKLFLVRVHYRGNIYVGKYNPRFATAYIPVSSKEVEIKTKLDIFTGNNQWLTQKKSKHPHTCAKTKEGKNIYAIRASIKGGIHIGMLIDGQKTGHIPYGGKSEPVTQFEILQE